MLSLSWVLILRSLSQVLREQAALQDFLQRKGLSSLCCIPSPVADYIRDLVDVHTESI